MNYPEFWLLEGAVGSPVPLRLIVGSDEFLQGQWNRPSHRSSIGEIARLLARLGEAGDIRLYRHHDRDLAPTESEIVGWLEQPERKGPVYELTSQGGARWEQFARADWDRYLYFSICNYSERAAPEENWLELVTTHAESTERAFQSACVREGVWVDRSTISRPIHRPWHATYWKSLPVGFEVRGRIDYLPPTQARDYIGAGLTNAELRALYQQVGDDCEYFQRWYAQHPEAT